jgi:hypothetical protein
VLADGGTRDGLLVLNDGTLAAVVVRVLAEESGDGNEGWYLEAGFGPCSILMTLPPQVFRTREQAIDWISRQLEEHPPHADPEGPRG